MRSSSVHTPKCNSPYLCVERHQYYDLLAYIYATALFFWPNISYYEYILNRMIPSTLFHHCFYIDQLEEMELKHIVWLTSVSVRDNGWFPSAQYCHVVRHDEEVDWQLTE
jgi:hypothetical protein